MSSAKWRPSCLGLSMLKRTFIVGTFPTNAIWQTVLKSSHVQSSVIERRYFICAINVAKPLTKMDTKFPSSYHFVTKSSDIIMKCNNISLKCNPVMRMALFACTSWRWHFPRIVFLTYAFTVYPKKYAHGFVVLCFVVVMQSFIMNSHEVFIHIHQGCFAGTGAIVRLPQCQWSKPDGYGKISQCITTTKHSKAKTVCIFLGIYCIDIPLNILLWNYISADLNPTYPFIPYGQPSAI